MDCPHKHFEPNPDHIQLLEQVAGPIQHIYNFGTDALLRFTDSLGNEALAGHQSVATLLYRAALARMDGAAVLICAGNTEAAMLVVRSLIEAGANLEYLLQGDCARRAECYRHWALRNELESCELVIAQQRPANDPLLIKSTTRRAEILALFQDARCSAIDAEYQRLSTNGRYPKWHAAFGGPSTTNKLLKQVVPSDTLMLYSFLSDQVHVNQALTGQQVDFATKRGWFRAIRSPEGAEQVALLATTFGLMTTHTFIEKLQGEGELERYAKWYVEEFKPGYDRLRKIEIKMNHIPQPS